jgi:hypothetical protein
VRFVAALTDINLFIASQGLSHANGSGEDGWGKLGSRQGSALR